MSTLTQFFGGGGGIGTVGHPGLGNTLVAAESGTYRIPESGTVDIYCIGGGGGGLGPGSTNITGVRATGAGAGGCAIARDVTVTAGDTIVVTIGAGGNWDNLVAGNDFGNLPNEYNIPASGNATAGGSSTVNSNTISGFSTLTANGGGHGEMLIANAGAVNDKADWTANDNLSGGAGGNASGGTDNYSGGSGGNITGNVAYTSNAKNQLATGGGGVGIFQNGGNGGNITFGTDPANFVAELATGGGGFGGNGGNITRNAINTTTRVATGGGGTAGSAPNQGNSGNDVNNNGGIGLVAPFAGVDIEPITDWNGRGGDAGLPFMSGNDVQINRAEPLKDSGGSGCGGAARTTSTSARGGNSKSKPFVHIGGGAGGSTDDATNYGENLSPGFGGGGGSQGGAPLNYDSPVNALGATGGQGVVLIVYTGGA